MSEQNLRTSSQRFSKRRTRDWGESESGFHWLGEGRGGQEALFLEVEPTQFFLDQIIASQAASLAHSLDVQAFHRHEKHSQRPFALLVPPETSIGWQLGYLSKHYSVYDSTQLDGLITDRASEHFGAQIVGTDFEQEVEHFLDFCLLANPIWQSWGSFRLWLEQILSLLSDVGILFAVLPSRRSTKGESYILWEDGTESLVEEGLIEGATALKAQTMFWEPFSESRAMESERIASFLKRNRAFFGKNVRDLLFQRIRDEDFLTEVNEENRGAMLLRWQREL